MRKDICRGKQKKIKEKLTILYIAQEYGKLK